MVATDEASPVEVYIPFQNPHDKNDGEEGEQEDEKDDLSVDDLEYEENSLIKIEQQGKATYTHI